MKIKLIIGLLFLNIIYLMADDQKKIKTMEAFDKINNSEKWAKVLDDSCTEDWQKNWTLDGKIATVKNTPEGMVLSAGPVEEKDASHAVLWTKKVFAGDIKIDYEFTRLDDATKYVNILYFHAAGSGKGEFKEDIAEWADLRTVASMRMYFNHMNLYHISYAAFGNNNDDPTKDYIRARRYIPETDKGLDATDLSPDNFNTGFFAKGIKHRITVIKKGDDLFMKVSNPEKENLFHWKTDTAPPLNKGRIGLRQMLTRRSEYKNFKVYSWQQ